MPRPRLRRTEPPPAAGLASELRAACHPLAGPHDLDRLVERIGDARFVLLGGSSHGTSEYHTWRTAISERLIRERGFSFVAVEGDWPDCYRVNRYVKRMAEAGESARDVLRGFERWPTWMWANEEVATLAERLRQHNAAQPAQRQVGFYGLDVYGLWGSLYAILGYLQRVDPSALAVARRAFRCFEPYRENPQTYAHSTLLVPKTCEDEVVALLTELRRVAPLHGAGSDEAFFEAEQNALALRSAESYYRTLVRGGEDSWNIRDRHMAETLQRLVAHHGPDAKAIVWEHNTHIGDARATDMAARGLVSMGQLVREAHARDDVAIVGFSTYQGSVIAGRDWETPPEHMRVPPARAGSWDQLLHEACAPASKALLVLPRSSPAMLEPRGQRAIGVVYHPEIEHLRNYVPCVLPRRYDALVFIDRTQALCALGVPMRDQGEVPDTFPSGL